MVKEGIEFPFKVHIPRACLVVEVTDVYGDKCPIKSHMDVFREAFRVRRDILGVQG